MEAIILIAFMLFPMMGFFSRDVRHYIKRLILGKELCLVWKHPDNSEGLYFHFRKKPAGLPWTTGMFGQDIYLLYEVKHNAENDTKIALPDFINDYFQQRGWTRTVKQGFLQRYFRHQYFKRIKQAERAYKVLSEENWDLLPWEPRQIVKDTSNPFELYDSLDWRRAIRLLAFKMPTAEKILGWMTVVVGGCGILGIIVLIDMLGTKGGP